MLSNLAKKMFGSRNDRLLKHYRKSVVKINNMESELQALDNDELKARSEALKQKAQGGEPLDNLLVEAFAVCREASKRVLGMRHFDVQLMGGMALHEGKIAEMRTGEGKTLVGTLAVYLNALPGKGVHVVTVNDYLASRDAATMRPLYEFLGLTVGTILADMDSEARQAAYGSDITYGTNNEFGFDYLRDNMVDDIAYRVQRELNFAVVDEVDSILIDEARTPLIISGAADEDINLYQVMNQVPAQLVRQESEDGSGDYWVDEKAHQVILSDEGHEHAEDILVSMGLLQEGDSLYSLGNITLMHHLIAALRAHSLYFLDQHYVVQDGEIIIVDEFTGRLMTGRRWSEGLHQAVEAKEGVQINQENQTLASITFQNYFRLYHKLSGMTGTADTEAYEFQSTYGLETVIIPTNRPMIRKDLNDQVYKTAEEKYEAVIADIQERHQKGQPVLVGTTSIENSELVSRLLTQAGLYHNVLNAKEHAREADIVAQAGKPGMITVATNMAGRGTDIVLGGNIAPEVKAIEADEQLSQEEKTAKIDALHAEWERLHEEVLGSGGLHIVGTERHESRRIDNQLRGRAGRQGDPGSSRFYLSFEDPLLRLFAMDRAAAILNRLAPERGVAIEHGMLTRQIEGAQRKVEGRNFDVRKQLLEYDDVANDQRKVVYHMRYDILNDHDVRATAADYRREVMQELIDRHVPEDGIPEEWDLPGLQGALAGEFNIHSPVVQWFEENNTLSSHDIKERILKQVEDAYAEKSALVGEEGMENFEKRILLHCIDTNWREHLSSMDYLRQGIHLRGYAQKDPKQEYKKESFAMFQNLLSGIKHQSTALLVGAQITDRDDVEEFSDDSALEHATEIHQELGEFETQSAEDALSTQHAALAAAAAAGEFTPEALRARGITIHRNDPCPCGSGLKYKQCHGKLA